MKSENKQILKVTALYVIWNPEICQDPPTCSQDDLVLLIPNIKYQRINRENQTELIIVKFQNFDFLKVPYFCRLDFGPIWNFVYKFFLKKNIENWQSWKMTCVFLSRTFRILFI
jgi:hypothetical protein